MKKCPYCGKKYTDDFDHCLTDGEPLLSEEVGALPPPLPVLESAAETPPLVAGLSDRQMRIIEVVLVCFIAFGSAILTSIYSLFYGDYGSGSYGRSAWTWVLRSFHEVSALGLLGYVLTRQKKSFANLGLKWKWSDIGWAVILIVAGSLADRAVYESIYFCGFTTTSHHMAGVHVGNILFGGGMSLAAMLFQFLNPFFEELIVRAYVMTEIKQLANSTAKAIFVSIVLQTSYHFYQGAPSAFARGAMFLVFSIYYAKTNRITPIILAHLYFDVGGTFWYWLRQ